MIPLSAYAYMLRFALQPGHFEEERIHALSNFCRAAEIDDVMFFIAPLNLNHIALEEASRWIETIGRAQEALTAIGVTTSINPLNTLLHDSAGNVLPADKSFRLMVDPQGNQSGTVVCPLCPEWREYITGLYAFYATMKPYALWVEDDFRFHNHNPLAWGGCFCDHHLREFAERAGMPSLHREAFVRGLLAEGQPHPYRQIWLESCRSTLVQLAQEIGDAVHRVSPETRIGLMSSVPSAHAAEGRDWHGIINAFGGSRPGIIRPHLPAYMETSGIHYSWEFNATSRQTAALIPENTEVYPELENVPYTAYSKSAAFQKYQLETALLLGSKGITLNIVDMIGNGIYAEERAESWLSEEKAFLNSATSLGLRIQDAKGVQVLMSERSSGFLHTSGPLAMEELYPRETFWASLLSAYGISNTYAAETPKPGGILALSGQILRNYGEAEIRRLFAEHFVLLDGEAAHTLHDLGLGALGGIAKAEWRELQTIEQIVNDRTYASIKEGRMRPHLVFGRFLDIEYEEGAANVISQICTIQGEAICPGMTIANGRVFILPYDQKAPHGLLNPIRRAVLQETIGSTGGTQPLRIANYAPHTAVYEFRTDGKQTICLVNNSLDDIEEIKLAGGDLTGDGWMLFSRSEPQGRPIALDSEGNAKIVNCRIPALSVALLHRSTDAPGLPM
ncbi:hypothetical protein [Cohnella soli]|uniref:Beta-galactosidase trimerisation domain-containing protein n=1 Tax=Cohnella soli TaxID=425005 RepID=A0ABW0HTH6_9BACL